MADPIAAKTEWWRTAVTYQCYLRSFRDSDGSGVGDLQGLRDGLDHLVALGVDAIWINPCYPSPQKDAGYDVADYRDIEPSYGSLADIDALIADAHDRGLRVLMDIVPNHTSDQHVWFQAALAGDDAARGRYIFRPGLEGGEAPPNDWQSNFGGPAWSRVDGDDGEPGDWYLHLFAPEQPDLDWTNPEVVAEFEDVLRFWFDRGVDGFRIDVAHGLAKRAGLPDAGPRGLVPHNEEHPAWDQDEVHEIYRGWRRVADSYDPPRCFVAETWVPTTERLGRYVRPDELHATFDFDFLRSPFEGRALREVAEQSIELSARTGAPAVRVLSNHDVVRQVTRYARTQTAYPVESTEVRGHWSEEPADLDLGRRRARAAVMLMLALPGAAYLYQGEELGLAEVEDIPDDQRDDPMFVMTEGVDPGRDGCRIPLPWTDQAPSYGFSDAADTWLPQPEGWGASSVATQEGESASTLTLYRDALRLRRELWVDAGEVTWLGEPGDVVALERDGLQCWLNTGEPVALPPGEVVLASGPLGPGDVLPPDTAVWLRMSR